MIFVDGLGLGNPDPEVNPVQSTLCPCLAELLGDARPIDACLGVDGFPQSATGQTALLTGVNAARLMGRHIEGFPGPRLADLIVAQNIFKILSDLGLDATFANGYFVENSAEAAAARIKSVTTIATLSAFGKVRNRVDMERGEAVCHDLTRETLRGRGYRGPLITPEQAADHLLGVAEKQHFTLFEFFQTDRAGHKGDAGETKRILRELDAFLGWIVKELTFRNDLCLVLTSDHGNIESLGSGTHTRNPVPFVVVGNGAQCLLDTVDQCMLVDHSIADR